jgi:CHAT domain-containing protein
MHIIRRHSFWLALSLVSKLGLSAEADFDQLINQGRQYLQQDQYFLALDTLSTAGQSATTDQQRAQAAGLLGQTHYRMHHFTDAEAALRLAIKLGQDAGLDHVRWLAALANLRAETGQREEATRLYRQALRLAGQDKKLQIGIRLDQNKLAATEACLAELNSIGTDINAIDKPEERAALLVNLASQASQFPDALKLAYQSYQQASLDAAQNPRLLTEALAGLAGLYESQQRTEEALQLNDRAIQSAQALQRQDLLLELHWRQGRLLRSLNRRPEALAAFRRAVENIESIRQDIPVEYENGRSSFRETLEPVYLSLADLLLQQAKGQTGSVRTQSLRQARDTVERIKQSELEDFLGGRCALRQMKKDIEGIEAHTAVIYPIILPDRLELLVSSGMEIAQFTQPVDSPKLHTAATKLAKALRNNKQGAQTLALPLYQWLIAPLETWLRQHQVETLVIVPDGVLRLVPFAALHNGQHYLIEKYNVATAPGLSLLEPSVKSGEGSKFLLAGMSEPGPVVGHLPLAFLQAIGEAEQPAGGGDKKPLRRTLSCGPSKESEDVSRQGVVNAPRSDPAKLQRLRNQLKLPGVNEEIDSLGKQMPNTVLKNEAFTVGRFKDALTRESYTRVHIASHGVFSHTAEDSFIMAFDNVIHMDDLEKWLKSEKLAQSPLDLITLSACRTAEGDDRAPLGFSGIAVKAKAGSALGALWKVNDDAASKLMAEFYQALAKPGTGKAQALRQAQQALLKEPGFEHPYYWAAFVLVGNWL